MKLKDSIQVTLPPTYLLFDTIKSVGRNQQTPIDCSEYALLASCCLALCYRRFHHVNDRRQINHYDSNINCYFLFSGLFIEFLLALTQPMKLISNDMPRSVNSENSTPIS